MDTPERNQICSQISMFEDSPVFNYINSLSPIKPVKSAHTTQTFNSLILSSPPPVFTSPHVNSHKESKFLRRHQFANPSKCEFSDNGLEDGELSKAAPSSDLSPKQLACLNPGNSTRETSPDPADEHLEFSTEFPQTMKYVCGTPDSNVITCDVSRVDNSPEAKQILDSIQFVDDDLEEQQCSAGQELELHGICRTEKSMEVAECNLGNLVFDAADLLVFNSPIQEESDRHDQKTVDAGTLSFISTVLQPPQDNIDDIHNDIPKTHIVDPANSCLQHEMVLPPTQSENVGSSSETDETKAIITSTCMDGQILRGFVADINAKEKNFCQSSGEHSVRRRCLVFEMAGLKKKSACCPNGSTSVSLHSYHRVTSNEKQLIPVKTENGYSSTTLPGIGLHLNALANISEDSKVIKHENLASGRFLISMPSTMSTFKSLSYGQKSMGESSTQGTSESDLSTNDHEVQDTEDASQISTVGVSEELDHSSPKRKRPAVGQPEDSLTCKRCNCKKSKCLKLYCECFASGLYCIEPCSCQDCLNKPIHEETVLQTRRQIQSRNPLAFAPKVIRTSDFNAEFGEESNSTPASARHKRGCNCKKSSCLKKYCECFQGGVGCSISCRCEGCKNTLDRKDGSRNGEDKKTESHEKNATDNVIQKGEDEEHSDIGQPMTPSSRISRPTIRLPFTFTSKPLGFSLLAVGSSSEMSTCEKARKPNIKYHQPKFGKHHQMIPEGDTPEILKGSGSPAGVKSASPNCKRISPPHHRFGPSPDWRRSRKLILRSIPTFPSLSQHESSDFLGKLE